MKENTGLDCDTSYEWKAVALLALGFGFVGLDRFMVLPMFPVMMRDLGLTYPDLGLITGALSVAYGVSSLFMGGLSDKIGRRRVLIGAMLAFSILVGASGIATGLVMLVLIRTMIGLADGAYGPTSIVATLEASPPSRHGRNLGIQQMMMPLFGLGIAPILVTQLLQVVEWRWIFPLVTLPGLLISYALYRVLRDNPQNLSPEASRAGKIRTSWKDLLKYRNIPLNMMGMLCWLICLIVTSAMIPGYLTEYLHLNLAEMGFVMSAIGFGASLGTVLLPWLSDHIGRKPVMLISVLSALASMLLLINAGASPTYLFVFLFGVHFFNFALIALTVGPLSAEAVPPQLMATASGLVIFVGEIFGGGIAPIVAGYVAHYFGVQYTLYLAVIGFAVGAIICLFLKETSPFKAVENRAAAQGSIS